MTPRGTNEWSHATAEYILDDFEIHQPIGSGGCSTVCSATHSTSLRKVAIKMAKCVLKADFNEARLLAQNSHPHIVDFIGLVLDKRRSDVCIGFVMEFMEIGSLSKVIHDSTIEYDILQACQWIEMIASAVSFLHENNIIHRDINPNNVLLGQHLDDLKLADLGFATSDENNCTKTRERGSPSYMAPEVQTEANYSKPADVYSLGTSFWEIVYREIPYSELPENNNPLEIAKHVANGGRPQLSDSFPMLSEFLKKTWDPNPNKRVSIADFTMFAKMLALEQIEEAAVDDSFDINDPMNVRMKIYELQVISNENKKVILQLQEELAIHNNKFDTLAQQITKIFDMFSRQKPSSIVDELVTRMKLLDKMLNFVTDKQPENQQAFLQESMKVSTSKVDSIAQFQEESIRAIAQQARQNISAPTSFAPTIVLAKPSTCRNKTLPSLEKKVATRSKIKEDLASETNQITNKTEVNSTPITQEIGVCSASMPGPSNPRLNQTSARSSPIPQRAYSSSRLDLSASVGIPKPSSSRLSLNNVDLANVEGKYF